MKIKQILFAILQLVFVAGVFAQNSYWKCGTIEVAKEQERRARMILSPGYGPSYVYSPHFLVHFDTTGPNITTYTYAESVSMYAESLWKREAIKLSGGMLPPDYAGPDSLYDIFIRNISSYDKIFSGESLDARWSLSYIECDNNTFKSQTVIRFPLSTEKKVSILIYDQSGELVKNFDYGKQKFGVYTLRWDSRDNKGKMVEPGVYFYTLKIPGLETEKSIIFFLGNKMGVMKQDIWEKTSIRDSTKKTEESGSMESISTSRGQIHPLDYSKQEIISKATPKEVFRWADSLYNYTREELKKAPIENDTYKPDGAYARFATMGGYLATIIAIDGYLLAQGVPRESLPASALFGARKYEAVLMKIPVIGETLVSYFWVIYNDLFIQRHEGKWEVKKTNAAFDKVKFIIKTLKEEARKGERWEKTTAADSTKKTEGCGGDKPSQELILRDDMEVYDILALKKRELLGKTSKETFWRAESIYKEARIELKKAPIENGFYQPGHSLRASDNGYLAAILAIDGYLLSKGVPPESMPRWAIFSFEKYEAVLMKIPNKGEILASSFKIVYNNLIIPNYTMKQEVKMMNEGLEKVKFIIETLKEEAMKGKSSQKTAVNGPSIKIEECGFGRTHETLLAPFESLDIKKKLLTGKTSTDAFKEADSLYKYADELLKKNSIKNGFYQSIEYVKEASGMAYLAALRAIEAYLLSKGVSTEKLPVSTSKYSEYKEAIIKIPHKGNSLTISLETAYDKLFWFGYFWGGKEDKVIKEGLSKVKFIINTLSKKSGKQ